MNESGEPCSLHETLITCMEAVAPQALPPQYQCGHCSSAFSIELLRIQHIRSFHPEVLKYSCDLCGIKCETEQAITRHIIGKHIKAKRKRALKNEANPTDGASVDTKKAKKSSLKKSPSLSAPKAELACLRYALIHGKHKAQLRFAKLQPDMKLGWRKISDLISKHKLDERFEKHYSSALKLKVRGRKKRSMTKAVQSIPENVKNECAQYAAIHGLDEAQWEFTIRYPNYVFPLASVTKWTSEMQLQEQNTKTFDSDFVKTMNELLQGTENLTIGDAEAKIKDQVQIFNQNKTDHNIIDSENAVVEWLHIMNAKIIEKQKGKLEHCACGNAYKTEEELLKHKPKCWVPESQMRSQRACRIKATASECETISDTESNSSPTEEALRTVLQCSDCHFSTSHKSAFTRHAKICIKKRNFSNKPSITSKIKNEAIDPSSCDQTEVLTLKSCKKCTLKHISMEGLREHYRVAHNTHYTDQGVEISLTCTACNDTFITYAGLREHVCGERQVTVTYERIRPRVPSSIMLGTNSVVVFLCPRCVTRFDTMQQLKEHHSAKTCTKVQLYA